MNLDIAGRRASLRRNRGLKLRLRLRVGRWRRPGHVDVERRWELKTAAWHIREKHHAEFSKSQPHTAPEGREPALAAASEAGAVSLQRTSGNFARLQWPKSHWSWQGNEVALLDAGIDTTREK